MPCQALRRAYGISIIRGGFKLAAKEYKRPASDTSTDLIGAITRGSMVVTLALGITAVILILLVSGGIKIITGDFPPGFIMLLAAGFVSSMVAGWYVKSYQDHFAVLGIAMLTIAGIIWAVFEDGYMGKAFMLLLVVTAGAMAAWGFYNIAVRKTRPDMP